MQLVRTEGLIREIYLTDDWSYRTRNMGLGVRSIRVKTVLWFQFHGEVQMKFLCGDFLYACMRHEWRLKGWFARSEAWFACR